MKEYAKTIVAVVMAALVALQTALTDGGVSSQEWITIALAALGAIGVLAVPNALTARQRRQRP
jgi:hypothetical protein